MSSDRLLANAVGDLREAVRSAFSFKAFWRDMMYRENSWAHQGMLIVVLAQTAIALAHSLGIIVKGQQTSVGEFCGPMSLTLVILGALVLPVFAGIAVFIESISMLLVASLNSLFVVARVMFTFKERQEQDISDGFDHGMVIASALIWLMQVVFSLFMLKGGMSRFMCYRIGTDKVIQINYRFYEFSNALGLLMSVFAVVMVTVLFFLLNIDEEYGTDDNGKKYWLFSIGLAISGFVSLVSPSGIRLCIRREKRLFLLSILFTQLLVSLFFSYVALHTKPPAVRNCSKSFYFIYFSYMGSHLVQSIAVLLCVRRFGTGMVDVFQREKPASELVNARYTCLR